MYGHRRCLYIDTVHWLRAANVLCHMCYTVGVALEYCWVVPTALPTSTLRAALVQPQVHLSMYGHRRCLYIDTVLHRRCSTKDTVHWQHAANTLYLGTVRSTVPTTTSGCTSAATQSTMVISYRYAHGTLVLHLRCSTKDTEHW